MKKQDGINLMKKVTSDNNLWTVYQKVYANKGVPGVDGITVKELESHMLTYYDQLKGKPRDGTYNPQPVQRVAIPKAEGSKRYLGIPSVLDRVVQQAIFQVINPIIDPTFRKIALDSVKEETHTKR